MEIGHFENRETGGLTPVTRSFRVDVRVRDVHGRTFIVEMQRKMHGAFIERCIWYGAKAFGYNLSAGATYEGLKPVYVIAFLEEQIRHEDESLWNEDHFISCYQMTEKSSGEFAPDTIHKDGTKAVAKKMLCAGISADTVASCTGMTLGDVMALTQEDLRSDICR